MRLRQEKPVKATPPRRDGPVRVKVSLNDTLVGSISVPVATDFADYSLTVPAGAPSSTTDPGYALVHIETPKLPEPKSGTNNDPRVLGIQIDAVEISP